MDREVFKPIIGFPDYEISNLGTLISYKNLQPRHLKLCQDNFYRIFNPNRELRSYGIGKLIYAAFNDMHPDELKGIWVHGRVLGDLKLYTKEEHIKLAQKNSQKKPLAKSEAIEEYIKIAKGLAAILKYFDTGDAKEVFSTVYSYSQGLASYIRKRKFTNNEDTIEEAVSHAQEECIIRCLDGSTAIADLGGYMRAVIRSYFKKDAIHKAINREYKEYARY